MRRCIHCGCTDDRACMIPVAELEAAIAHGDFSFDSVSVIPKRLDDSVPCWWIKRTPPVCSSPACVAKERALPRGVRFEITPAGRAALALDEVELPSLHVHGVMLEARAR